MAPPQKELTHEKGKLIVREISVVGWIEDDQGERRTVEIHVTHEADGHFADAMIWGAGRVQKELYYKVGGGYEPIRVVNAREADNPPGWKVDASGPGHPLVSYHCVWVHDDDCTWWLDCGPEKT